MHQKEAFVHLHLQFLGRMRNHIFTSRASLTAMRHIVLTPKRIGLSKTSYRQLPQPRLRAAKLQACLLVQIQDGGLLSLLRIHNIRRHLLQYCLELQLLHIPNTLVIHLQELLLNSLDLNISKRASIKINNQRLSQYHSNSLGKAYHRISSSNPKSSSTTSSSHLGPNHHHSLAQFLLLLLHIELAIQLPFCNRLDKTHSQPANPAPPRQIHLLSTRTCRRNTIDHLWITRAHTDQVEGS